MAVFLGGFRDVHVEAGHSSCTPGRNAVYVSQTVQTNAELDVIQQLGLVVGGSVQMVLQPFLRAKVVELTPRRQEEHQIGRRLGLG